MSKLSINLSFEVDINDYDYRLTVYRNGNQIDSFKAGAFKEITEKLKDWEGYLYQDE